MSDHYHVLDRGTDRKQWLEARRKGIGASDMPGVFGVSPFASPLSVYADKVAPREYQPEKAYQRFGRLFEAQVIADYQEHTERRTRRQRALLRSNRYPYLLATPDAWTYKSYPNDRGTLQVKTQLFDDWEDDDALPLPLRIQVEQEMLVTGVPWCGVACFSRMTCETVVERECESDPELRELIIQEGARFWQQVESGAPPSPDDTEATKAALFQLYPQTNGEVVTLSGDMATLWERHQEITAEVKALETEKRGITNEVLAVAGNAERALFADGTGWRCKTQHKADEKQPRKGYSSRPVVIIKPKK